MTQAPSSFYTRGLKFHLDGGELELPDRHFDHQDRNFVRGIVLGVPPPVLDPCCCGLGEGSLLLLLFAVFVDRDKFCEAQNLDTRLFWVKTGMTAGKER